jgi:hypothetical protein
MKKLLLIFLIVGLFGCNSHLNKSIFEPLTVDELKKSLQKDSLFKNTYEYIQYVKDTILKSDLDKVRFADLTYKRIHDFAKFSSDTSYFKPIDERIKKDWSEKYGRYQAKVDSISNYWKNFKNENSLEQYVKVELAQLDKEYYSYSGGIRNVNLGFRLTPLKGQVDQIRFSYRIEAKINEKDKENIYESIYSAFDKSWCLMTSPLLKPVVRYWEANYSNEKILSDKTLETFFRDYNIYIEIDEIRKDGKNMSSDDLNIPKSIMRHWEYENRESLKDLYVKNIIKEILDEEYLDEYEYNIQEKGKILKEKDPVVFDFVRLPLTAKTDK